MGKFAMSNPRDTRRKTMASERSGALGGADISWLASKEAELESEREALRELAGSIRPDWPGRP